MNLSQHRTGLGIASKRFLPEESRKPCQIGGVTFENMPGLDSRSDGDVIFHALCNAISSITSEPILGQMTNDLLEKDGITDSRVYVQKAVEMMKDFQLINVAITIEGKKPFIYPKLKELKVSIAKVLKIDPTRIGITAISGDGLTDFGLGFGLQAQAIIQVYMP